MADTREQSLKCCIQEATRVFNEKIDGENLPSVAAYAPGRVNLIGEHTDYNEGCVFPMVSECSFLIAILTCLGFAFSYCSSGACSSYW